MNEHEIMTSEDLVSLIVNIASILLDCRLTDQFSSITKTNLAAVVEKLSKKLKTIVEGE